jgi:hypothetical protein
LLFNVNFVAPTDSTAPVTARDILAIAQALDIIACMTRLTTEVNGMDSKKGKKRNLKESKRDSEKETRLNVTY